jgi:hypothetical protein
MSDRTRALRRIVAAVSAIALLVPVVAEAAQATGKTIRRDPLGCGCNCSCVANAMFKSKKHALSWAKAYYEKCGCG